MTTPCNGCADRCLGCHAACARFAAYKDDLKAAAEYLHQHQYHDTMHQTLYQRKRSLRRRWRGGGEQ